MADELKQSRTVREGRRRRIFPYQWDRIKHREISDAIEKISAELSADAKIREAGDAKRSKYEQRTINLLFCAFIAAMMGDAIYFAQMNIAQDTAKKQLRAYVYPVQGSSNFVRASIDGYWFIQPEWENNGDTPALHMTVETRCLSPPTPVIDPLGDGSNYHKVGDRILGPHQKVQGISCQFSANDILSFENKQRWLYIVLIARYDDEYGAHHIVEHCAIAENVNGDPYSSHDGIGYSAAPCETHECTDEDCGKK
jgi:hypothetical protein